MPIREEDIRPTVAVVINEAGTEPEIAERGGAHPGRHRDVAERTALIVVERPRLLAESADDEVLAAVMVVVGEVHSHSRSRATVLPERHACGEGSVGERSITVVMPEEVRRLVVRDEDVLLAVLI